MLLARGTGGTALSFTELRNTAGRNLGEKNKNSEMLSIKLDYKKKVQVGHTDVGVLGKLMIFNSIRIKLAHLL